MPTRTTAPAGTGTPPPVQQAKAGISFGNAVALISLAVAGIGAFYNVKEGQAINAQAIAVLREADLRHEVQLREIKAESSGPLAEIKLDVKDLRAAMSDVKESLAILRGRASAGAPQR